MHIEIQHISKNYGKKKALDDVNFVLDSGIYGLLGENGAGKSTLINIMVTSLAPSSGCVLYNGKDIRDVKSGYLGKLGYMPQSPRFYKNYTAEEFIHYMAALKGVQKNVERKTDELLQFVNLSGEKKAKIGTFSGGMLQRLGIAQALLNDPKILILDEPTAGLDPKERIRFRNLISAIAENRTVIVATHIVPDIEYIAHRVILLHKGKICCDNTPDELCEELRNKVWMLSMKGNIENILNRYKISNIHKENDVYHIRIVSDRMPHPLARTVTPTLEDVFLYYVGDVTI